MPKLLRHRFVLSCQSVVGPARQGLAALLWRRLPAADITEPPGYRLLQSLRNFPGNARHLFVGSASLNGAGIGGVAVKAAAQNAGLNGR